MGTNFYWISDDVDVYSMDPKVHIGKRSAAGMYCWDCGITLCKGGESQIHMGTLFNHDLERYDKCPRCGKYRLPIAINRGVAVELGFAKPRIQRPTGVQGCSSFSWAQDPPVVRDTCLYSTPWRKIVVNEYGDKMTGRQFIKMLEMNCPVQYTRHVGTEFS